MQNRAESRPQLLVPETRKPDIVLSWFDQAHENCECTGQSRPDRKAYTTIDIRILILSITRDVKAYGGSERENSERAL